jgi:SAM-dependent methyltransferase
MKLVDVHERAKAMTREEWCEMWVDHIRGTPTKIELPPFPPDDVQKITNNISGVETMKAAASFYRVFDEEISGLVPESSDIALLDYGAGWGRITRLVLRNVLPARLYAADVDERLVRATSAALPGINVSLIRSGQPLPYGDATFGVVISNSVFSHLSPEMHMFYVKELGRVLKPGGLFLGTTLATKHYEKWLEVGDTQKWITGILGDPQQVRDRLSAGEIVYGPTKRWADYGIAILPDDWVKRNWTPLFNVLRSRDDYTQRVQVALRSRG